VYFVWANEGCIATEPMREFPTPFGVARPPRRGLAGRGRCTGILNCEPPRGRPVGGGGRNRNYPD